MSFLNCFVAELWKQAKGNKKEYAKLMRARRQDAILLQERERVSNLKRMLAKGVIDDKEYTEKLAKK